MSFPKPPRIISLIRVNQVGWVKVQRFNYRATRSTTAADADAAAAAAATTTIISVFQHYFKITPG